MRVRVVCVVLAAVFSCPSSGAAAAPIPPPRDVPYPAVLRLQVDATDFDHRMFHVNETIPVVAGSLVLRYPKWLPDNHSMTGPVELLAGLRSQEYTRDDAVRTLGELQPADRDGFLRERMEGHGPGAPLEGLARSGWRLLFSDQPSPFLAAVEKARKQSSFAFPLGLTIDNADGRIADVLRGSPAFAAGLAPGMTLLAVNGRAWSGDVLKEAVVAATGREGTIDLLVKNFDLFQTAKVADRDGPRYPHLERIPGTPDRLADLLKLRT